MDWSFHPKDIVINLRFKHDKKSKKVKRILWYFVTKIVQTYCEKKKCSCDREQILKFDAESPEFAKGDQQSEIFKALKMRASYSF